MVPSRIRDNKGNNEFFFSFFLFIIWPFATLLYSVKKYRASWAPNIFWLFTIFFGFTFVIVGTEVDASRYKDQLETMYKSGYSLQTLFSQYLNADTGVLDIAQGLVTFIVSRFTSDYRFLFATFGFFLGYFLSRAIWFIIRKSDSRVGAFSGLVLICYALVVGIWDMGGIRWNIAAVMFAYFAMQYLTIPKGRYLWLAATTALVHWSFPLALAVLLFYKFYGNRTNVYYLIFLLSFVISEIDIDLVRNIFNAYAPNLVQESRSSYLSDAYIDTLSKEGLRWYINAHVMLLKWFVLLVVSYLYLFNKKQIKSNVYLFNLFNFALLFYGIFNTLSSVPSMIRFLAIGNLLVLSLIFLFLQSFGKNFPAWLKIIGTPVLILFMIVRFRIGFDFIGLWTIIGSPVFVYFVDNDIPLIQLIKELLP